MQKQRDYHVKTTSCRRFDSDVLITLLLRLVLVGMGHEATPINLSLDQPTTNTYKAVMPAMFAHWYM